MAILVRQLSITLFDKINSMITDIPCNLSQKTIYLILLNISIVPP